MRNENKNERFLIYSYITEIHTQVSVAEGGEECEGVGAEHCAVHPQPLPLAALHLHIWQVAHQISQSLQIDHLMSKNVQTSLCICNLALCSLPLCSRGSRFWSFNMSHKNLNC
jgi:hypothetical protein